MWRQACVVLGALAFTCPSFASEPANGWYSGADLGFNYTGKIYSDSSLDFSDTAWQIFTPTPIPVPVDNSVFKYSPGMLTSFYLGYRFSPNWRAEAQAEYVVNSISDWVNPAFDTLDTLSGYGFSGRHTHVVGFIDAIYDLAAAYQNTGKDPTWVPYIGGGVGYGRFRDWFTLASEAGLESQVKFDDITTAGQFIAGVNYYFDSYTSFFIDYRYQSTLGKVPFLEKRYTTNTLHFGVLFNMSNLS